MNQILAFIFGIITGSFLNVVILRLPKGEKINGRSRCPTCGHTLSALDLIPVLSYLWLLGRCRYCGAKISPRYAIIELIAGVLFLLCFNYVNPGNLISFIALLNFWLIVSTLVVVFVIDFEHFLILDQVMLFGSIGVLLINLVLDLLSPEVFFSLNSHFFSGLLAAFVLAGAFYLLWYFSAGRALGFGDVKLAVFLGLALGWPAVFAALMLAIFLGGVASVVLLSAFSKTLKSQVPFGTFLSLGSLAALFYGQRLVNWYLAILGF